MNMTTHSEEFYPHVMVNVSTTPLDLIILLHDGAIEALQKAIFYINNINKGDGRQKVEHISRTMAIVEQLLTSLDLSEGGDAAFHLQRVYAYMLKELARANIMDNARMVMHVQDMLKELKRAWRQVG